MSASENQIVVYQPNETVRLDVRLENETVWLNRHQMAQLFGRDIKTIGKHIANALSEELASDSSVTDYENTQSSYNPTVAKFATVQKEGNREVVRQVEYYSLDVVLSVGYRVKSAQGILFRRWANTVLKEYLLRGYSINTRLNQLEDSMHRNLAVQERRIATLEQKVDFFVQTQTPPLQGVFYDGQLWDARALVLKLIGSAKRSLILIDNWATAETLDLFAKKRKGVKVTIITSEHYNKKHVPHRKISDADIATFNAQYPHLAVRYNESFHDRFLIVDDKELYLIGASLKDLGKKCFGFTKMDASEIMRIKKSVYVKTAENGSAFGGKEREKQLMVKRLSSELNVCKSMSDKESEMQKGKSRLTCLDLFCGAGGLSCGLHMAGIETVAGIDFDQSAINTFNVNGLGKGVVADLEEITSDEVKKLCGGRVDIVAGGPPCQGFSLSGFRDESDKRNRLYKSFVRIVKDLKPRAFILENVPGLVSLFGGRVKDAIVSEFSDLGYNVVYKILTASEYGVPQHRRRVVFVGLRGKRFEYPKVTHFKSPKKACEKKMVSCMEALSDLPSLSGADETGTDIQDYATSPNCEYQELMRKRSKDVRNHIAARHSEKVRSIIALVPPGKNYKSLPESFRTVRNFHVAWTRFPDTEPSPTIDTGHRHHFHYKECRVPTVRECARLQSFPDNFHFTGNKTQQFRQVGNAVPPLMAMALGKALKEALNG